MKKWECTICGYIHEGDEPPDECPLCGADKDMFVEVEEKASEVDNTTPATEKIQQEPVSATAPAVATPSLLQTVEDLILKHHLHPITVHTPNGILPVVFLFLLLAFFSQSSLLEAAAFYNMIFVLITMPLVLFTGYTVWQKRYKGALTTLFKIKISASVVVMASLIILILWRIIQPEIMSGNVSGRWLYLLLSGILVGAAGIAGHMGGKLIFGGRDKA